LPYELVLSLGCKGTNAFSERTGLLKKTKNREASGLQKKINFFNNYYSIQINPFIFATVLTKNNNCYGI
jgi:hypothetical protein